VSELDSPPRLDFSGQVTMLGRSDLPASDLPLQVVSGASGEVTACASTDEFGEFACAVLNNGPYGVRLGEAADAPVVHVLAG
jgi:hypothetical protein